MNYRRIYNNLIMKAWRREDPEGYTERHHIIPKCLGGGESKDNLVRLTAAEHYIAHLLLMKMYPSVHKIALPILLMAKNIGINTKNKLVARAREKAAESQRGKKRSKDTIKKMSEALKGRQVVNKGKRMSDEQRVKLSKSLKGREAHNKGKSPSQETRDKLSKANKGRKLSEETRMRMSISHKGTKLPEAVKLKIGSSNKGKKLSIEAIEKMKQTKATNRARKEILNYWCAL